MTWTDVEELLETVAHEAALCLLATAAAVVCWLEDRLQ